MRRGRNTIAIALAALLAAAPSAARAQSASDSDGEPWIEELDGVAEDVVAEDPGAALADPAVAPSLHRAPAAGALELFGIEWRASLEARARGEMRQGAYVGEREQWLVSSRLRLGLEARWDVLRAFVQVQDARDFGVSPGGSSGATTGVHQGFFELGDGASFVRVGRQEIDLGGGRLVGSLNWASPARSFDALRGRGVLGPFALDATLAMIRVPRTVGAGATQVASEGDVLAALAIEWSHSAFRPPTDRGDADPFRLAAYLLYRHDGPTEAPPGTPDAEAHRWYERHRDVGAWSLRASGRIDRWRYEIEGVLEAGATDGRALLAAGAIGELGYTIDAAWQPEIGIGASVATGEGRTGVVRELDNFFPSNHLVYGLADLFGLRNQAHGFVRVSASPIPRVLSGWIAARAFAFLDPGARWTDAPGRVIGVNAANRDAFAGVELDGELRWAPIDRFSLSAGYALFLPGGGAAALGRPDPSHFGYAMAGVTVP
jgi:hypothetical protein